MYTPTQLQRFDSKIERVPESGCWIWTGSTNQYGYGTLTVAKQSHRAHRFSWLRYRGAIPEGKSVCHRCDVPACVNPDHLFLGSHSDNMRDMHGKQRHTMRDKSWIKKRKDYSGDNNPNAKFNINDVLYVRSSDKSAPELALEYGVHRNRIYEIRKRLTWKDV